MESKIKVSVLIPCHSIKFLAPAAKSIENQTLNSELFEVVIIADRIDIIDARNIMDKTSVKYRIVESFEPGIVAALNLGLTEVNSEFIARMDDDDLMMPTRLEDQLRHLEDNPEVLAVGGQLQLIDDDNQPIGIARYRKKIGVHLKNLLITSPLAHPATMFRLASVLAVGGYRSFLAEDWDLWVRLCEYGKIENLETVVLMYRIHPNQLSRKDIYWQSISRQYVSTSFFARKMSIRDHPETNEVPAEWLKNTQEHLRKISNEFVKFEKSIQKQEEMIAAIRIKGSGERLFKTLIVGFRFPILFAKFALSAVFAKIKKKYD